MADGTTIEWTEATWNIITGCSVLSPGCTNCYAQRLAGTRMKTHPSRIGLTRSTKAGPIWNGEVRFNEGWLDQPLRWRRPRRIFVCGHSDLFHESVPDEWLERIFSVMAHAGWHTYQLLTKRPARMRDYVRKYWSDNDQDMPDNWWFGVSCEDQPRADERIPLLLETPAAVRWVSYEPLLGSVDLRMLHYDGITNIDALSGRHGVGLPHAPGPKLDWVVVGGESGPGARPMELSWAYSLVEQCRAASVPVFYKQGGRSNRCPHDSKGGHFECFPTDLQIREYPDAGQ